MKLDATVYRLAMEIAQRQHNGGIHADSVIIYLPQSKPDDLEVQPDLLVNDPRFICHDRKQKLTELLGDFDPVNLLLKRDSIPEANDPNSKQEQELVAEDLVPIHCWKSKSSLPRKPLVNRRNRQI